MNKKIFLSIKNLLNNMVKDHISESAAQCAYYAILSFVPFVILLLTSIQYTSIESNQLFEIISNIIPKNMQDIVLNIIREVYSKSIGTISWSLIFTLYSAAKSLFALTKELHFIYNFTDNQKRSWIYLKVTSLFQTIIFIISVTVGLVIMVFGKTILSTIQETVGVFKNYTIINEIAMRISFLVVSFIIFLLIYKFMSKHRLKLKSQINGALIASVLLNIVSYIFSRYLDIFKGFSTTYGSLTSVMLTIMWTYTCFYIIFLGAEINKLYDTDILEKHTQ